MNDGKNLIVWLLAMALLLAFLYFLEIFLHVPAQ